MSVVLGTVLAVRAPGKMPFQPTPYFHWIISCYNSRDRHIIFSEICLSNCQIYTAPFISYQ
ncbi:Uncharacterised protein [Sphingobacterium multivorum]|uniref:Uncharacterized protein n=1 Tax=Sphingobacterium multivorum TaxID=28454 RepID=A0A2X2IT15_SPHMU|nr:Uncharacterised protein [Sphingobacterium multivorum]